MMDISAFWLNIQLFGTESNTKCRYICQKASNWKSEGTLFSSTFKIEENKVPSDFRLEVSWQRYRHFHYFLFHGVGLFYIILRTGLVELYFLYQQLVYLLLWGCSIQWAEHIINRGTTLTHSLKEWVRRGVWIELSCFRLDFPTNYILEPSSE